MRESTDPDCLRALASLPDRIRLPLRFDAAALAREAGAIPSEDWTGHFVPENFSGEWSVFPLRVPLGASHPILRITSNPGAVWEDSHALAALPAIRAARARFRCEVGAMRLMKLGPGSQIHEHRDADLSADFGTARIHVPIATGPEVEFQLAGTPVSMQPGECWYLRLSEAHAIANRGEADRIHLVLDAEVNPWLADLLQTGAAAAA